MEAWHRMLWMWPVVAAPRPFWRSARRHPPMSRHLQRSTAFTVAYCGYLTLATWCNASKLPGLQLWEPKKSIHLLLPLATSRSAAHTLKMHDSASHEIIILNSGRWMEMTEGLMTAAFTELCRDIKSSHTCKLEIHTSGYKWVKAAGLLYCWFHRLSKSSAPNVTESDCYIQEPIMTRLISPLTEVSSRGRRLSPHVASALFAASARLEKPARSSSSSSPSFVSTPGSEMHWAYQRTVLMRISLLKYIYYYYTLYKYIKHIS